MASAVMMAAAGVGVFVRAAAGRQGVQILAVFEDKAPGLGHGLFGQVANAETQSNVSEMEGFFKMDSFSRRSWMAWAT